MSLSSIHPFPETSVSKSRNIPTISDLFDKKHLDFGYHDLFEAWHKKLSLAMQPRNTVVNMHESPAIKAYEKFMKEKHTKFHTKIVVH